MSARTTMRGAALALVPLLVVTGCAEVGRRATRAVEGSGSVATEERSVAGFRSVAFALPGELVITVGEPAALRLEGDDDLLGLVVTRVRGGTLEIRAEERTTLRPRAPMRVHLIAPVVEGISAAGSGNVQAPGLRATSLALTLAGSGRIDAPDLQAAELRVELAGSGNLRVSGTAARQTLALTGSGSYRAYELESETVEATVAGSGSAQVHATRRLDANVVGSGGIRYRGSPEVATRRVGSGSVEPEGP